MDGGRTWNQVGRSENRVYVTLSEPALNSVDPPFSYEVFETALEVGSRNAIGARTTREVIDGVWEDFKGPLPGVLRKTMNGLNEPDGLEMKYWLDNADPETSPAFGCQSVGEMLTPEPEQDILAGVGTCRSRSQLMHEVIGSQGIDTGTLMRVFPEPDVFPDLGRVGILVKNWEFNGDGNSTGVCPGFTHVNGVDLNDLEGLPGQGVGNPPAFFNQHFIVLVGGRYYDPSYGSGPFGGTSHHQAWEAWEDVSIDGFYKRCGGRTRVGRAQAPGVREIAMADEDAEDEPEEPAP